MYTFYIAMNADKWKSLPADIQKIFDDVDREYVDKFAVKWNEINADGFKYTLERGNEVITLPDAEAARWVAAVQPVMENYVSKMSKTGTISEADARAQIAYIKERMAYWTPIEKQKGIPSEFDYLPK
jgi:TRAP-type C4-dicarboxylate transport system substrate-binding protein